MPSLEAYAACSSSAGGSSRSLKNITSAPVYRRCAVYCKPYVKDFANEYMVQIASALS